jgi:hypothetical protein
MIVYLTDTDIERITKSVVINPLLTFMGPFPLYTRRPLACSDWWKILFGLKIFFLRLSVALCALRRAIAEETLVSHWMGDQKFIRAPELRKTR